MIKIISILALLVTGLPNFSYTIGDRQNADSNFHFDVVVVGSTPGGVAAAVNAAREGASVIILQGDRHIGGLAAGGQSNPDFRSFESLGGTYREYMQRVEQHYIDTYGSDSRQVINSVKGGYAEPRVARMVFENMLEEAGVHILLQHRFLSVTMESVNEHQRIRDAQFLDLMSGNEITITGDIFIDGTYEGDVMAAAGVPYRVGREGRDEYGEKLAPDVSDHYVQAYNFRVVLTTDPENQISIERPAGYNREDFALLVDFIHDENIRTHDDISRKILRIRRMPNDKAEFNDVRNGPVSLALTEINNRWPEGDHETRAEIYRKYKEWSLGILYFLQNDSEVPEEIRSEMQKWALPADEYVDTDHWSPALYVREARRMVGKYVFTEHDAVGLEPNSVRSLLQDRSVAISDYPISTHGVRRPVGGRHEGVIGQSIRPMQIPFDIMLPDEIDGLLVPVAVSSSHVGFGGLRYEPLWTALGQAAGVAAAKAIKNNILVRDIKIRELQLRLHELGAMTIYVSDLGTPTDVIRPDWEQPSENFRIWLNQVPPESPLFRAVQFFGTYGFFHHLIDPAKAENWSRGHSTGQWHLRMPYHTLEPDQLMDKKLAADWLQRAIDLGIQPAMSPSDVINKKMSRGEFLQALFELL